MLTASTVPITLQTISAGKFRRYHHLTLLQHLMTPSIVVPNIRDLFLVMIGFTQAIVRMILWRPDVVFTKGGFVCLPVGYAAWLLRIPLVLHDSDVVPGLTNRLLAKKATYIATGAPVHNYPYDARITSYVGIPISAAFVPYSPSSRRRIKQELGFDESRPLTVIIGGGLGAKPLNDAVLQRYDTLLETTNIFLLSGKSQYEELKQQLPANDTRLQLHEFVAHGIADIMGAADVVVSRAGATALLELAALHKPTIVVPSSRLTWQVKHAKMFADEQAVVCLDETQFAEDKYDSFVNAIAHMLTHDTERETLAASIGALAMPNAAEQVADMIRKAAAQNS